MTPSENPTIQVKQIQFPGKVYEDGSTGCGYIHYLILDDWPYEDMDGYWHCDAHPGKRHRGESQPFQLGAHSTDANGHNTWGWDGNHEAPTLSPSLGLFPVLGGRDFNAHLFFRKGQIELCGDATVVVHPNPVPCYRKEDSE